MRKFNIRKVSEAGSLMVEAIAMLGLISMVTPVVYKKSAERMNELQDINAASQMRALSSALDAYLSDNYADITKCSTDDGCHYDIDAQPAAVQVPIEKLAPYLPQGMVGEDGRLYGVLGEDYKLSYVRNYVPDPNDDTKLISDTLTGYVAANNEEGIDAKRASRIATMIGGNGGVVENQAEEDKDDVFGAQGVWQTKQSDVGFAGLHDNSIVAASSSTVGSGGQIDTDEFLHRHEQSRSELNTMYTDLYMYDGTVANDIMGVGRLLIGSQVDQHEGRQNSFKPLGETPPTHEGEKNYSLYVGAVDQGNRNYDGSAYIQDALHAVEDQFKVEKESLTYNPFTAAEGTEGEEGYVAPEQKGTFEVNTEGLKYTDPEAAEFSLTDNTMTYGNNFIKASTTKAEQGTEGQEGYSAGRDDNSFQVLSKEIVIDSDMTGYGDSRVETRTDLFVANHKKDDGNYRYSEGDINDEYTRIGDNTPTEFANNGSPDVEISGTGDNVLTGRTVATEIETGYLKTHDFDVARLRAGREDLEDDDGYGWELQADEDSVEMGAYADYLSDDSKSDDSKSDYSKKLQGSINRAGLRVLDKKTAPSVKMQVTNSTGESNTFELNDGTSIGDERDGGLTATINDGGIDMEINKGGNYNVEVKNSGNYTTSVEGGKISLKTIGKTGEKAFDKAEIDLYSTADDDNYLTLSAKNDNYSAEKDDYNKSLENSFFGMKKDGTIEMDSINLKVDNSLATVNKHFENVADDKAQTNNPWVYVRRGSIGVRTDYDDTATKGAIEGTGYVLADRFVVENGAEGSLKRDPRDVYKNGNVAFYTGESQDTQYDHYMVDPAYTSVMHDIKLTSRGGARLSDILPDFINKGIYVVDNSYDEGLDPDCFDIFGAKTKSGKCNNFSQSDYASAFLGSIPAPQCPPGYAKVITLQPSGWTMGQVGTLVIDVSNKSQNKGRAYIQPIDNYGTVFGKLDGQGWASGTIEVDEDGEKHTYSYEASSKSGSVQNYSGAINQNLAGDAINAGNVYNELKSLAAAVDRLVQSSTYMKSAIKVKTNQNTNTSGSGATRVTYGESGDAINNEFMGWDTYIGFIYPASYWSKTALNDLGFANEGLRSTKDEASFSSGVFWNLFPVDKYSIEGYATVYCYFDRGGIMNGGTPVFNESMVDTTYNQFEYGSRRNVEAGSAKDNSKGYVDRLFNPKLKYNDQW